MTTTIHFVRHGHVYNPHQVLYGRLPRFRLSESGVAQAQATAQYLTARPIQAVFSSPMLRARQTADIILERFPYLKRQSSKYLNEVYTRFDGQPLAELQKIDWEFYADVVPPYESPADLIKRVFKFMRRIRHAYRHQEIVAVTHGDLICFTIAWSQGLEITGETKRQIAIAEGRYPATGSITTFQFQTDYIDEKPDYNYVKPYE